MFSSVGGFRFVNASGLRYGIYLMAGVNDIVQGYQTSGGLTFFTGSPGTTNNDIVVAKLNNDVSTNYGVKMTGASTTETPSNMVLDSSNNQYIVGETTANTVGNRDAYITKFDSSGSQQWQRTVGATVQDYTYDVAMVDSGANIVVTGRSGTSTLEGILLKMRASDGALLLQKYPGNGGQVKGVATDSSNNIYIAITQVFDASRQYCIVVKMDSSFNVTWARSIGYSSPSTLDVVADNIAVDSSGNVYVTCSDTPTNNNFLVKLNSSGTVQWQTTFNYQFNNGAYAITTDNSGNVYIGGDFGSPIVAMVLKFDSSGTLLWGRGLNGYNLTPSNPSTAEATAVNNITWYQNRLLINGNAYYAGVRYGMLLDVPDDGSLVGTYPGGFVWGYSPFTKATSSLTVSSYSQALIDTALTDAAGTLTPSSYGIGVTQNIVF